MPTPSPDIEVVARPVRAFDKVAIYALAAGVHTFTLSMWMFGALLLFWGISNPFMLLPGLGLLALAWAGLPRVEKRPDRLSPVVESPELGRTIDRIAEAVGTSAPYGFMIDASFDARAWRFGWRQRTVLSLGLPLLSILDSDEFTALIARELARTSVERHTESVVISLARSTLERWNELLYREKVWPESDADGSFIARPGMPLPPRHDLTFIVAEFFANSFLWAVSWIPSSILHCLAVLTQAQRAATQQTVAMLVAQVSGAEAFSRLRVKRCLAPTLQVVTQRAVLTNGSEDIVTEFQAQVRMTDGFSSVRRRGGEVPGLSTTITSRPTSYPDSTIASTESIERRVVIGEREYTAIRDELNGKHAAINRELISEFRTTLYPSTPR